MIHVRDQLGIAGRKNVQSFLAATGEPGPFPDLIKASRITLIADEQILAAYPQPTGNPNVDGVFFRQRTGRIERLRCGLRRTEKRD
jgi:hypothetical protein